MKRTLHGYRYRYRYQDSSWKHRSKLEWTRCASQHHTCMQDKNSSVAGTANNFGPNSSTWCVHLVFPNWINIVIISRMRYAFILHFDRIGTFVCWVCIHPITERGVHSTVTLEQCEAFWIIQFKCLFPRGLDITINKAAPWVSRITLKTETILINLKRIQAQHWHSTHIHSHNSTSNSYELDEPSIYITIKIKGKFWTRYLDLSSGSQPCTRTELAVLVDRSLNSSTS